MLEKGRITHRLNTEMASLTIKTKVMLKKKNITLLILGCIGIIVVFLVGYPQYVTFRMKAELKEKGSLNFLIQSDKDDMWTNLLFIKRNSDSLQFDSLLTSVLSPSNLDLNSIIAVNRYIKFSKRSDFLPEIKNKYTQLISIGTDSCWTTTVRKNYSRKNSLKGSPTVLVDLSQTISKMDTMQLPY